MIKSLKRKFGISAPRVAIRPQTPAYVRWLVVGTLAVLAVVLSWGMYDAGRKFAGFDKNETSHELDRLSQVNARLQQDNDELRMKVAGLDRQVQMDLVAREDITRQIKGLEDENIRLKENLAFFQSLGSATGKTEQRLSIGRLKLERGNLPGEYRYSMLLVQGGQRPKDFQGSLEFSVNFQQNGEKMMLPLADSTSKARDVTFKFYQRIENTFHLPPDAVVDSMQVKVFEKGVAQARLTQTVNLSL
ncbi:DUF6776 family protein [Nitrosovibrio sp. Nv4]|uniref:DUF6776 family protein n=1 Tax=Nitrosovibrio sp. Nv4 TaxID=1945880 RepID=UPI000BC82439|nr:DUF6776 family protein [Nitrosovibrio sp. Nv4]SOD40759.1 hypothetical protein SAMN06298226_1041 [Nitrosovibrio sp. Nv4]